jgi:hypothetical protein
MARFSDLPFELQTDIWALVLPHRGGVHWVELEGIPHPSHIVNKSLEWTHDLFDGREPDNHENIMAGVNNKEYKEHRIGLDQSSLFFESLYAIVPSVFGKDRRSSCREDVLAQDVLDEIADTQRCRQLSTYTQVATLLMVCQTSRLAALEYLRRTVSDFLWGWPLYRGAGPIHRVRPLSTWKQQYQNNDIAPRSVDKLIPTICSTLDLVVYRLHTALGHPKEILKHAYYQMEPCMAGLAVIPEFNRIGIEWHSLWATPEGRKELCEDAIRDTIGLAGNRGSISTQLYWLVDGIPRPQWDQYPPAIPVAFSRVIERRKDYVLRYWLGDKAKKDRLLKHHNLHQEFEANGRRYYVVFVLANWTSGYSVEREFRDPALSWDGAFPGGENLWPEALRDPVRVAYQIQEMGNVMTDSFCSYVMSWEPI